MSRFRYRLTPDQLQQLCDRIKGGAFDHVAAESLGITAAEFEAWFERGQRPRAARCYREFHQAIVQARAHARVVTETEMRREQPRQWLLHGPGKETPTEPGWTAPVRAGGKKKTEGLSPEMLELLTELHAALEPFPEARAALAELLARRETPG